QSSPNVVGNLVYIGSLDSRLYALSTTTGSTAWSTKTGGPIHSSPAVSNGDVYVGSDDHKIYAMSAASGAILWTVTTGDFVQSSRAKVWSAEMSDQSNVSPAVAGGLVYTGSTAFGLNAYDATTGVEWLHFPAGSGIVGGPIVVGGAIYFGVTGGTFFVLGLPA